MKTTQWAHQKKEWEHRLDPARAWFWQMRTGKSKMAIDNACFLAQALEIGGVLIVAPNGVHRNWIEREIPKHHWDDIRAEGFSWRNSNPNNAHAFNMFMGCDVPLKWLAVNMESLIIDRCKNAIAKFIRQRGSVLLVVDESHHFAVPGAKRTAVARGLGRLCSYRRILSGTPVENSPLQAFSQFEILQKGALGYTTYGDYKGEYAKIIQKETQSGKRFPFVAGYKHLDELKARMAEFTSVVLREDVEDLPAVQIAERLVDWDPALRRHWLDCKSKTIKFLQERGARNIPEGGAALVKLQQIEGGFWKQDSKIETLVKLEANPKIAAAREEVELHDGQVIIWAFFRHELDALHRVFGEDSCVLYGGTPDRQRIIEEFRRGKFKVALCQYQAVSEGQDFSTATKIINFSQTPDAILRAQANERATAVGKGSVQIVDLITPGGSDAYYRKITSQKTTVADDMSRRGMLEVLDELEAA